MSNFNEVITFIETKVQGIPVLYTAERLDKKTIPKVLHVYDVTYDEHTYSYDLIGINMQKNVLANIVSFQPLKLNEKGVYKQNSKTDLMIGKSQDFINYQEFHDKYSIK